MPRLVVLSVVSSQIYFPKNYSYDFTYLFTKKLGPRFRCTLVVLRSESPSGICEKLRTVAASNNRDHAPRSLNYCLFAPHVCILLFAHIPFVVNHTINTTPLERLQQHPLLFTTKRTDRTFFL